MSDKPLNASQHGQVKISNAVNFYSYHLEVARPGLFCPGDRLRGLPIVAVVGDLSVKRMINGLVIKPIDHP